MPVPEDVERIYAVARGIEERLREIEKELTYLRTVNVKATTLRFACISFPSEYTYRYKEHELRIDEGYMEVRIVSCIAGDTSDNNLCVLKDWANVREYPLPIQRKVVESIPELLRAIVRDIQ